MHRRAELNELLVSLDSLTSGKLFSVARFSATAEDNRGRGYPEASKTINPALTQRRKRMIRLAFELTLWLLALTIVKVLVR